MVPSRHQAEPPCILCLTPVQGGSYRCEPFCFLTNSLVHFITENIKQNNEKNDKNVGLGFLRGGTQSAVDTTPSKMVLGLKEGINNLTVDECGTASTSYSTLKP